MLRSRVLRWPTEKLLTKNADTTLRLAVEAASLDGADQVSPKHLLLGILKNGRGVAVHCLRKLGLDTDESLGELMSARPADNPLPEHDPEKGPYIEAAIKQARLQAHSLGHRYIGTEHLLLGLIDENHSWGARFLKRSGITYPLLRNQVIDFLQEPPPPVGRGDEPK